MVLLALPLIIPACSSSSYVDTDGPDPASLLNHDDPHQPLLIRNNHQMESNAMMLKPMELQMQGNCCGTIVSKGYLVALGEEHSAKKLIWCVDFWLYYTAYFCGATVGLVYSNNLGQIAQSLHQQSQLTMLLIAYSSCSFFGRLLSALPDILHRKVPLARTGWLAAALVPMPMAFFLMWNQQDASTLVAGTTLVGLSSGFIFAAAMSVTSELFGPNSIGVNHNILITNIPLGSLLYGQIAAMPPAHARAPSVGTSCRCHRRRSTLPRWRSLPRCKSHGGGKPVVTDTVDEVTPDKGPETEIKGEEENEAVARRGAPGWLRLDGVAADILAIAAPAVLALAADPITALVDTAFVGHIGSAQLEAVGASTSIFNLVSKLFNVPLLNVTTSFVAEQQAMDGNSNTTRERDEFLTPIEKVRQQKKVLPAVSTSLALATGIGLLEMVALIVGSGTLINIIGIPVVRAGNLLNAVLDALLIFPIGLGVSGAALATVTSEYLTAFILLWKLNNEVDLFSWNIIEDGGVIRYLKSGGLLIGRTIAVFLTLTLSTSLATREGPIPMVGYEICLQLWLTISLLNDALALAGQALLASEYAKGNYKPARVVLYKVLQVGGVIGFLLAASLFVGFGSLSLLFTDDPAVLDVAHSRAWFFVGAVSSIFLLVAAPKFGLDGIWAGLTLFMSLRAVAGF
ncbi:Protein DETOXIFICATION 44 chloroplastic [Zea mays]|uniref:Protein DETOXIFICATION n=1 Tax=Zea mays TaxID=4577 RepID=A0A1D6LG81_MAIZE|nr:Protein DETOXIFICATION 44 chloroplastic [Zea mays]